MRPVSKQTRKQRGFLHNAPLHLRRKMISSHLSKELRQQYKRRAVPVRKGDEVEIMRGKFFKKKGKVSKVDYKNYKIYVEGVMRKRTTGIEVQVPISPSNVRITNLNLEDELRKKALARGKPTKQ